MTMEERKISKDLSIAAESRRCDSCKMAAAMVFCRADSAYLCSDCDGKVHTANKLASRHERVVICEVCGQVPASVTCKADAASLCSACDSDIHSANPLARRHVRIPVIPICQTIVSKAHSASLAVPRIEDEDKDYEIEEASRFLLNPKTNDQDLKETNCLFSDIDSYLDFDYGTSLAIEDRLVPVQNKPYSGSFVYQENELDIDFNYSYEQGYSYTTQSLSHGVSSSSLEVGVVPDAADVSNLFEVSSTGIDSMTTTSTAATTAIQLSCLDREARVLRYREKKKNRKFQKTIRYASRKAYAETRPRVKGRFAKRTDMDVKVDHMYSEYGLVHLF